MNLLYKVPLLRGRGHLKVRKMVIFTVKTCFKRTVISIEILIPLRKLKSVQTQ